MSLKTPPSTEEGALLARLMGDLDAVNSAKTVTKAVTKAQQAGFAKTVMKLVKQALWASKSASTLETFDELNRRNVIPVALTAQMVTGNRLNHSIMHVCTRAGDMGKASKKLAKCEEVGFLKDMQANWGEHDAVGVIVPRGTQARQPNEMLAVIAFDSLHDLRRFIAPTVFASDAAIVSVYFHCVHLRGLGYVITVPLPQFLDSEVVHTAYAKMESA